MSISQRPHFVIIGFGNIGRELVDKISRDVEITIVEINSELEEEVKSIRKDATFIVGDATSRLILEQAKVNEADIVLLTTSAEVINIEVAKVLKASFEPRRIISIGISPGGIKTLEEMGVEAENIFVASAIGIRNRLNLNTRTAYAIGIGKEEILEVEIHPSSRLINQPISSFAPYNWRVGIIYRNGEIIVPRGDSRFKPYDRVIILGEPSAVHTVSEILTFSFRKFPLEYGPIAAVYVGDMEEESFFQEINYLFTVFPLERKILYVSQKVIKDGILEKYSWIREQKGVEVRECQLKPLEAFRKIAAEAPNEIGLTVISGKTLMKRSHGILGMASRKKMIKTVVEQLGCPFFICRNSFPYRRIAVPGFEEEDFRRSMETACEVSMELTASLSALLAKPAEYISSETQIEKHEQRRKLVADLGSTYQTSIKPEILNDNPVLGIIEAMKDYDLMISDVQWLKCLVWPINLIFPDILWRIIQGSKSSVLLIPPVDESL